jgi:hypothetical protein
MVMSESVQFWLDNKMSAGIKAAAIGDQQLVVYREKYYVVEKEAAHTKGGKPLRYSKSSLPAIWKRALRGDELPADALVLPADDAMPVPSSSKRERVRKPKSAPALAVTLEPAAQPSATEIQPSKAVKKKMELKPAVQSVVVVTCPHCNSKHDVPLEKGKNGKPFFMVCGKCRTDFAVRFIPVTAYQAQVAGFR